MNLENKNSFLLNSALFFSTMGSTATTLGFITYIFNTTHSPFNTGTVTIATFVNVNIRMYNFDDVQCTVIPSVAYGFVTGMNLQLC